MLGIDTAYMYAKFD